jgi:hypothetical protein
MSVPRFSVGEVVVLCSAMWPELNGERTVLFVVPPEGIFRDPVDGSLTRNESGVLCYVLDDGQARQDGSCFTWAERALRKRHTPGEYSFEDLKTVLHLPVTREEMQRVARLGEVTHG